MKNHLKSRIVSTAVVAVVGLFVATSANAALVTWEPSWSLVTDNTAIKTLAGFTTYGGVNFNGSNTTISNGTTNVDFTGIAQNSSGATAGITVSNTGFGFQSTATNNSTVVSAVGAPQTWATVLDRVIGDFDNSASISLSGLTVGSSYYVQFFSSAPDANILTNSLITSGGIVSPAFGGHTSGLTRSIVGSFTADGTIQSFTVTGTEPTYSALVVGVRPATAAATIPEPASIALVSLASACLLRRRRLA